MHVPTYILIWNHRDSIIYLFNFSHSNIDNHNTHNKINLVLPHFNKSKSQSRFLCQSIKQCNILPNHIKTSDALLKFKHKFNEYYYCLY